MTVWDQAQKLDSAKGSVWDAALALEEKPDIQEDPNEAYQTGKDIMDLSVEFGLPLDDIESNYQEISSVESAVFDPSEPPRIQQPFEFSPEQPFDIKVDKERGRASMKVREQKVKSITDFLALEGDTFSEKQKLSFLPDADLQYAADVIMTNPMSFDRKLHRAAERELRVRQFIGALKSAPDAKQTEMIVLVRAANLFNLSRFMSRLGMNIFEGGVGGRKGDMDAAIEAATRVLAEKNEIDPINTTRIVDLGAGVMKTAIEFWLTPGAQLANAPKAIRPMLQASAKFALREAIQAPAEGETLLQRAGSVTESGLLGLGVGAAGKFIPKAAVRVPVVVGGFAGLTYAKTGDIEASIETGVTVLGFEALGLMQKATRYTSIRLRNTFADKAVRAARAHNPDLFRFSNKEVGQILQKQMENWQQVGMERVIGDKSMRQAADNALRLKRQGDPTAWNALMKKHGFGQAAGVKARPVAKAPPAKAAPVAELPPPVPKPGVKPAKAQEVAEGVKEQNFTMFAREHGFTDDFSVLDHGQLSPSGKVSKRGRSAAMRRMEERIESNKQGHEAFRKAILEGKVIDPSGEVTKEGLLAEQKERAAKKIESRLAQIDAQIRFTRDAGQGKRGTKPSAQKQIDALEEERKRLTQPPTEAKPTLSKASIHDSTIRLSFDALGKIPTVDELKTQLATKGIRITVSKKKTDIVSGTQGVVNYSIDVFDEQARSSSKLAKELFQSKIGTEFTERSQLEREIPLEGRFEAVRKHAVERQLGKPPTKAKPPPPPDVTPKQVAEITEKLPEAAISQKPTIVRGKKFYPVTLPTEQIGVDAKKFQFKLGAKLVGGVTEALKDVEAFDPVKAGQILVWQDKAGKYWVVDGHHRVALAKKTGAENLQTWVVREADGITAAEARAIGALRNLADGKGTAVDAAKLFRDADMSLKDLRKSGVPTSAIVQQGMDMKNLSDYVFRLVVDEKLPASFAAPIGRQVKSDTQQKQVADLILEGEIDTVRQAELLAATIDTAPVLTTTEQTLFGLETTEKSLYAERAKVLANVEKKLKTNKKVFGTLATQTGIIEAKGNVLAKVENLMAKEQAEEVLFMLEKLANSKGPIAEALNDATKEYAKNPTKENLAKVTSKLLQQWTEGAGRLRISGQEGLPKLPIERAGEKVIEELPPVSPRPLVDPHATALQQDKQRRAQQKWDKKHPGGKVDVTPLADAHNLFMSIIEPSKAVEIAQGKDVYAEVIKAVHKADVAMIEFNEKELENLDSTLGEWGKALAKYSNRTLELLMLSRGKPVSDAAILIRDEALEKLAKESPELVGTRKMITRASDFNYDYLAEVVGEKINYIEDYFYGIYKDPRKVEKFLDYWKTTKRFTKQKKLPTVADAKAFGLDLRDPNPVNNLRSEYLAIARLEGMIDLKASLMKSGEGDYIAITADAPIEWDKVHDPVFADVRVAPELAKMINNLISTNKITRIPQLNTLRQTNNFLRTIKFIGSAFHLGVEVKQSLADTGLLAALRDPSKPFRAITVGFRKNDPIFQMPWYRKYVNLGGSHRFSIDSEAQRAFTNMIQKMGKAGMIAKGAALPFQVPERFIRWMFENHIPHLKAMKYIDTVREQEIKLGRSLTDAEHVDIIKEGQNFYGMMNERLFGRSGTVTTILRFKFMAPGFAEGNYRTMLKAILQWGGNEGFKASRSRRNIINSLIISAIAASAGTLILTRKPPKKPEKLADIRDLFKIDTGQVDQHGRKIMIDLLTYDKDYWNVFGNLATLQPAAAVESTIKRLGGMTATTWEVISDLNQMSMGRVVYDWKNDRVIEVTDPFIQKVLKLSIHELKKAEPISLNVFQQARKKGVGVALSAAMTLAGVRLAKTEQDRKEIEILHQIFSLRDQQETLFWYLGTIKNPREHIKKYNQTVMRILNNPITPLDVKDEFEPKLIIDEKRLTANKVYNFLGDQARLSEFSRSPEKHKKEIQALQKNIQRASKWLRNFEITERQYKKHLVDYEELHRKIINEIQPEDDLDDLKKDLANFYANQTLVKRKIQAGLGTDKDRRLANTYRVLSDNFGEVARRIYDTKEDAKRKSLFGRIQTGIKRVKE